MNSMCIEMFVIFTIVEKLRIGRIRVIYVYTHIIHQPLSDNPGNVHYRKIIDRPAYSESRYQCTILRIWCTHLFVGQLFTAPLLANLVALVVAARCTVAAIVLLLASNALATALSLLLLLARKQKQVTVQRGGNGRHTYDPLLVNRILGMDQLKYVVSVYTHLLIAVALRFVAHAHRVHWTLEAGRAGDGRYLAGIAVANIHGAALRFGTRFQ